MSNARRAAYHNEDCLFTVRPMRASDARAATGVWYRAWCDTYVHPEGATRQWVDEIWKPRLSDEGIARLAQDAASGERGSYIVADGGDGEIIGVAITQVGDAGDQYLQALYIDAAFRYRGVGSALARAAMAGLDPDRPVDLDVARFNRGAQRFYRRLGFQAIPGSEALWRGVLPVVTMRRPAGWRQQRTTGARQNCSATLHCSEESTRRTVFCTGGES
ncbi:GNAT family N-acetyltransferase [Actinomyces procaprae]|uniref:GNAT family N-acetyltransferase n=1 Tax=Actinomyces procaprae TaxID=2560010 RepID=UPI0010A26BB8|nr:GNAT family N-acetyltransferase [Actinomyces procaprae]